MAGRIYRIGIEIVAHNHAMGPLGAIISSMMHLHGLVNQTNMGLRQMRLALGGAAGMWAGAHVLKDMGHIVDHGAKFVGVQNQMIAAGWKQHEIAHATAEAWKLSAKYQAVGAEEILEMQKEMAPVLGSRAEATHMAETMTKLNVALLGTLGAKSTASFNKQIMDAIRTGELSGASLQPEVFERMLDNMAKTLKAFGGTVTPHDYFMATKYGRASAMNWNEEFMGSILPTLMQEMGASSVGTAMMTAYQAIIAGRMKRGAIDQWKKIGMLNPNWKAEITPEGFVKNAEVGMLHDSSGFMENPFRWVWNQGGLIDHLVAAKILSPEQVEAIKAGKTKSHIVNGHEENAVGIEARKQATAFLATLFGDRTAQGLVDTLVIQYPKIIRDMMLRPDAMGMTEGANFFGDKDYAVAKVAFGKQLENLEQALGGPAVDSAVRGLHMINDALSSMSQVFASNPNLALGIMAFGTAFAGIALAVGGIATIIAIGGLLGLGGVAAAVMAVVAALIALGTVAYANAGKIKSWWASIKDWVLGHDEHMDANGGMHARRKNVLARAFDEFGRLNVLAVQKMMEVGQALASAVSSIPGMVMGAISGMASAIGSAIANAISGIAGWIGGKIGIGGGGGAKGGPSTMEGIQKQSFTPPASGGRMIQASTTLNVDGRRLAQAVTYHQIASATHVGYDAGFDGIRHPTPIDYSQA